MAICKGAIGIRTTHFAFMIMRLGFYISPVKGWYAGERGACSLDSPRESERLVFPIPFCDSEEALVATRLQVINKSPHMNLRSWQYCQQEYSDNQDKSVGLII
ncbi:unnamed protein product [Blepharisma stoltei]|uniref:Uncharacterized protein n=1 Tax=Blepharisma stoltei TaxID=1481888 RepID=A0AAU9IVG8_9CILI|nr:unnamed protein product [Blepharisma stoltei]